MGAVLGAVGLIIGVLRWRFVKPYRSGSRSPYPSGAGRLHHVGGLLVGGVLVVWLISGALSMEPWGMFHSRSTVDPGALQGMPLHADALGDVSAGLSRLRRSGIEPVELYWRMLAGQAYLMGVDAHGNSRILPALGHSRGQLHLARSQLADAVRVTWPHHRLTLDWLQNEDFYYYHRGEPSLYSHLPRRLPMLRVRFDDAAGTWMHIDPYSAAVIEQLDSRRRAVRWAFKMLHSWDWPPLLRHGWLRDALTLAVSAGVLLITASGLVLGWRRVRRPRRQKARM